MPPRATRTTRTRPPRKPAAETEIPAFLQENGSQEDDETNVPLDLLTAEPVFVATDEPSPVNTAGAGIAVDDAIAADQQPKADSLDTAPFGKRNRKDESKAKTSAPTADEWLDFFSRIVIRFMTEWYVDFTFRGIDEDLITDADAAKLLLTEDERNVIARPFAEFANKNPFMRKHGRQIVAFADSFESMVILGQWFSRVNRVARKYTRIVKATTVTVKPEERRDVNFGESPSGNGHRPTIPNDIRVFNPGSG